LTRRLHPHSSGREKRKEKIAKAEMRSACMIPISSKPVPPITNEVIVVETSKVDIIPPGMGLIKMLEGINPIITQGRINGAHQAEKRKQRI